MGLDVVEVLDDDVDELEVDDDDDEEERDDNDAEVVRGLEVGAVGDSLLVGGVELGEGASVGAVEESEVVLVELFILKMCLY